MKREINTRLRASGQRLLTDRELDALERDSRYGVLARFFKGEIGIDGVVETVRQHRRDWAADPADKAPEISVQMLKNKRGWVGPDRARAVSEFVVAIARQRQDLIDFRSQVLGTKLLAYAEVEGWINETARSDGTPTPVLKIALEEAFSISTGKRGVMTDRPIDLGANMVMGLSGLALEYPNPQNLLRLIGVRLGGTLNRLRVLSEELSDRFRWSRAEATVFVLTDLIPLVAAISANNDLSNEPVLDRVMICVDPEVPPRQVEQWYREMLRTAPERSVPISERRLRLAAFMRARPTHETYKEAMRAWNRLNKDMPYEQESNFGRDAKEAFEATRPRDTRTLLAAAFGRRSK